MKVKKSELKSGYQVFHLGENWDVIIEDGRVILTQKRHGYELRLSSEAELELVHPVKFHCVRCNKELNTNDYGIDRGVKLTGVGGYGSVHDDQSLEYAICDECIPTVNNPTVRNVVSNMEIYRLALSTLRELRIKNNNRESEEEDKWLDHMDVLWRKLTTEEIDLINIAEGNQN